VEELEEDPDEAVAEDLFDDEDNQDLSDPFEVHFANPDEAELDQKLKAIQDGQWLSKMTVCKSTRMHVKCPKTFNNVDMSLPVQPSGPSDLKLKSRIRETMVSKRPTFDPVESLVASVIFNYHDILFCDRRLANAESLRRMACLHAINHIFKQVRSGSHYPTILG
jgi:U3 small nucleolar RNA-associated protein 25